MFLKFLQISYFIIILSFLYFLLMTQTSQRRLLCMIFILLNFALLLLFLHYEYVAFIIIILYIGAISVLFLFIIMFVNISKQLPNIEIYNLSLFFYFVVFGFISLEIFFFDNPFISTVFFLDKNVIFSSIANLGSYSVDYELNLFSSSFFVVTSIIIFVFSLEIMQLGFLFWTGYGFLIILASFILIISIIGSVSILKGIFTFNIYKKKYISLNMQKMSQISKPMPLDLQFSLKGALTNKPQAFKFRAWELETIRTKQVFDSFVDDIIVDVRGLDIMRILPINSNLHEFNWLTDKIRFFFDSIKYQRVNTPLLFLSEKLFRIDWLYVLLLTTFFLLKLKQNWLKFIYLKSASLNLNFLRFSFVGFTTSFFSDFYTLNNVSALFRSIGGGSFFGKNKNIQSFCFENYAQVITDSQFEKVFKAHSFVFLNGLDLRYDLPKFYLFLKQKLKTKSFKIFLFNVRILGISNFNFIHLGYSLSNFVKMLEGRHWVNNFLVKNLKSISHFFFTSNVLESLLKINNFSNSIKNFCMKFNLQWFHLYTQINFLNLAFLNFRSNFVSFQEKKFQDHFINQQGLFFHENLQHMVFNFGLNASSQYIHVLLSNFHQSEIEKEILYKIKLPMLTLFERDFLTLNIFGKVCEIKGFMLPYVGNFAGKLIAKSCFDFFFVLFCLVNYKITSGFLKFLKTIFSSEQVFRIKTKFKQCFNFNLPKYYKKNVDQLFNCFISNFYKMDEFSKNSLILNNVDMFYHKDISNYYK